MRLAARVTGCQGGPSLRPIALVALAIAFALLTPSAGAFWSGAGGLEPDTHHDVAARRVWADPDTSPSGMRVYFDAVYTGSLGINPNLGTLGSRILTPDAMSFSAFLGLWKDCNRDGFIGHAEGALLDYPATLLPATDVCAVATLWNDGTTVTEFVHFAPSAASSGVPRVIMDREARIWGDFGRPEGVPIPDPACIPTANPVPTGTLDSTGGILMFVDCQTSYNVARVITEVDDTLELGIGFDGPGGRYRPDQDCDNPLNQQLDLYGDSPCDNGDPGLLEAGTGRRMVTVWDCASRDEGSPLFDVRDPTAPPGNRGELSSVANPAPQGPRVIYLTDSDGTYGAANVYLQANNFVTPVAPALGDTDGSLHATRVHLMAGLGSCSHEEGTEGIGEPALNGDFQFDPLRGKRRNDFRFGYSHPVAPSSRACSGSTCVPATLQVPSGAARSLPWTSEDSYGPPTKMPNGVVRRDDLAPTAAQFFTFYATVGPGPIAAGASLADPSEAKYGQEACAAFTSGVHAGWDCDGTHWWSPAYGEELDASAPRPGWRYQLRDVDCLDGSIGGGTGLFVGLAPFSDDELCPYLGE